MTSTLLALLGFYAALTGILMDHLGEGGYLRHFVVEIGANRIYLLAGLVTGPLFGALGAWVGKRFRRNVWLIVGSLIAGEIAVVALVQGHELLPAPLYFEWSVDDWAPYVAEFALGFRSCWPTFVSGTDPRPSDPSGCGGPDAHAGSASRDGADTRDEGARFETAMSQSR